MMRTVGLWEPEHGVKKGRKKVERGLGVTSIEFIYDNKVFFTN